MTGTVMVEDRLPPGLRVVGISGFAGGPGGFERGRGSCSPTTIVCTFDKLERENVRHEREILPFSLPPYEVIEVKIAVKVTGAKSGEVNVASVSGGGASSSASGSHAIQVGGTERFGIEEWSLVPENEGGTSDTQAGSHPFQLSSVLTLNSQTPEVTTGATYPRAVAMARDITGELPTGLVGNPTPFSQCTDAQFAKTIEVTLNNGPQLVNECPASSAVGVATVTFNEPEILKLTTLTAPIFNMAPRMGEPARFGFRAGGTATAFLDTSLRTGGDYGVNVESIDIPEIQWLLSVRLTFWGVPGDPRHDRQRGWDCLYGIGGPSACPVSSTLSPPPLLTMPTSCQTPFRATLKASSWGSSGREAEAAEPVTYQLPEALDGCNRLPFDPAITVAPDVPDASASTGLTVGVHVDQTSALNPEGLAEATIRDTTVALPVGVAVNPSGSDGLQACSQGLVGFTGFAELEPGSEPGVSTATFTPRLPEPVRPGANFCPDASKIGTLKIKLPVLAHPLEGAVYLASQNENPFGSLIAMYLVAQDPISGVLVKLGGETALDPVTGQLVSTLRNAPQGPLEDLELHFFGGERAPLATPARCGAYTTNAIFTPWSGNLTVHSASTFDITDGPHGSPCPEVPLPFAPALTAGTTNINAGAFTPLTSTIDREDGNQDIKSLQLHFPPGVSGLLSTVRLCPEVQANDGTCPPDSQIGETTVSAGVGSDPVTVAGGKVYLTERYEGAPFGLSIVNPVKAGPFDLEHDTSNPSQQPACDCLVVRARVEVDPHTAALVVTTDEAPPHSMPRIVDGVPVQLKKVNVTIDRERFTINPTSCRKMAITGTIKGDEGASSAVSVPFQVTNCASLKFEPKFTYTVSGKTSKTNGAGLTARVTYPSAPQGAQANIGSVKVELPRQLPSRLTTLHRACPNAQFETNPAACPPGSDIGRAVVRTPLLPVPLEGPAIFVSHGGEAFPSLTLVLQGDNITIDLVGATLISKGITSTTFKAAPDEPFSALELSLPQGPYSALAATANLCHLTRTITTKKKTTRKIQGHRRTIARSVTKTVAGSLSIPTEVIAQSGAVVREKIPLAITGCPAARHRFVKRRSARNRNR
jgi:hypothetical protein